MQRQLCWQSSRTREQWSLRIVVVQSNPEFQSAHLLLVIVKDDEIAINAVVLRNEVEKWHAHEAKSNKVVPLHLINFD